MALQKINQTGVEDYTETVGDDVIMKIRVNVSEEGKKIYATIQKENREVAVLSRELSGQIVLNVTKADKLTAAEFADLFVKSASVVAEIVGVNDGASS